MRRSSAYSSSRQRLNRGCAPGGYFGRRTRDDQHPRAGRAMADEDGHYCFAVVAL
jgi:hypothetical protein